MTRSLLSVSTHALESYAMHRAHELGQHFTPATVAALMVRHVPVENATVVADLSAGHGELLYQAKQEWPGCKLVGFDIDAGFIYQCRSRLGDENLFHQTDALRNCPLRAATKSGEPCPERVDVVLSNPPFGVMDAGHLEEGLLRTLRANDLIFRSGTKCEWVRKEVAFFVRNLQFVREEGYMAILLPETMICGFKESRFRRFVLEHTRLHSVLSLGSRVFDSSEAGVSLLVVQKTARGGQATSALELAGLDSDTGLGKALTVHEWELVERMDPHYYGTMDRLRRVSEGWQPLRDYILACHRGYGLYGADRAHLSSDGETEYVHSVNVSEFVLRRPSPRLAVPTALARRHPQAMVDEGDILVVRVGRGCAGRSAVVVGNSSKRFASDCLYVMKTKELDPHYLCVFLNTAFAKAFLECSRRGVCSRYLVKPDLLDLPVYVPQPDVLRDVSAAFLRCVAGVSETGQGVPDASTLSRIPERLDSLIFDATPHTTQLVQGVIRVSHT